MNTNLKASSNRLGTPVLFALALACNGDITVTETAKCDGVQQRSEDYVDAPFDRDGDGFFDANNEDCANAYEASALDCNDSIPEINPNAVEVTCDDFDNDCNEETADSEDKDGDGYSNCEDCDDNNESRSPGLTELQCNDIDDDCDSSTLDGDDVDGDGSTHCDDCDDTEGRATPGKEETCDDNIDNDCDGEIDENCEPTTWDGTWEIDDVVKLSCGGGNVDIDFSHMLVTDASPAISFSNIGGSEPGTMDGIYYDSTMAFDVDRISSGACTETYVLQGTFTSLDTFDPTFTAEFVDTYGLGGLACSDCSTGGTTSLYTWTFSGTRQ